MATNTRKLADLLANIDDNSKVTSAGLLDATITAADDTKLLELTKADLEVIYENR